MIKDVIKKLSANKNLKVEEAQNLIDFIAEEKATTSQLGAFLIALSMKGVTVEEISGFASQLRKRAKKIDTSQFSCIVDSCGTGGDCANTFNISTASAILASVAGIKVAKHSNFGFTSKCGSSNVVDALGLTLCDSSVQVIDSLSNFNIAFLHAPNFHKSTKAINPVRKEIGVRTVFNFLGPLTNPTFPQGQVLGVSDKFMAKKMVEALDFLGCKRALVVCGENPVIDEFNICGKTVVYQLNNSAIDCFDVYPEDFSLKSYKIEDLAGDSPAYNAAIIKKIFKGSLTGAPLDAVLLNASAVLWVGGAIEKIEAGIGQLREICATSKAFDKLKKMSCCL